MTCSYRFFQIHLIFFWQSQVINWICGGNRAFQHRIWGALSIFYQNISRKWLSSSDPRPDPLFWHSFWHTIWKSFFLAYTLTFFLAFYLASILTYFLAYMLTFFLALYLVSILTFFLAATVSGIPFWHSIWHLFWHSGWGRAHWDPARGLRSEAAWENLGTETLTWQVGKNIRFSISKSATSLFNILPTNWNLDGSPTIKLNNLIQKHWNVWFWRTDTNEQHPGVD